jgi:hypothetical protein
MTEAQSWYWCWVPYTCLDCTDIKVAPLRFTGCQPHPSDSLLRTSFGKALPLKSHVGVLLVYIGPESLPALLRNLKFFLQNAIFLEWAMLGSNQRPLPCEGSALPLS